MSFKPIDDRQVINRAALSNIGSPANDSLDDILSKINVILGGLANAAGYVSQEIPLSAGITSYTATIPSQTDTSYVVYALMENLVDATPQFQQPMIANKTPSGFTVNFNVALSSNNYKLSFIVPHKLFSNGETAVSSSSTTVTTTLPIPQNGSSYGIITALENNGDTFFQFQTPVLTSQSATNFVSSFNAPIASSNYLESYLLNATGKMAIGSGVTSVTVNLPINYNTSSYGVVAVMENTTDANPKFQPMLVTAKTGTTFTVSWNYPTATSNYSLYYYVITIAI